MSLKSNSSILDKVEDLLVPKSTSSASGKLKVLMVGAEVAPFASVGGYSRVLGYLSGALLRSGHDVRVFMPKFGFIEEDEYGLEMICEGLKVPTDNPEKPYLICNVKKYEVSGRPIVYFLENREYYELRANVYGYADDPVRWALLSRGVLEFLNTCADWEPDIIHVNDWHTGAVPNYLKTSYKDDERLQKIATVFTIHNLSYQGMFDHRNVSDLDFDDGKSQVADFFDHRLMMQNFMRRGIMYADAVNAVSPTYAREIMKTEYGEGLDRLLTEVRSKVSGILNGIDYTEYNPATDKLVPTNFDSYSLEKRVENKIALQKEFDLKADKNIPIFSYVGRLEARQKGLDLLLEIIPPLMRDFQVQFVFVGGGDVGLAERIRHMHSEYPEMIGTHLMLDYDLPRLVFSGTDFILMPSRFEPCGLSQMEGMRYGAIPVVHNTGGLADSVEEYKPEESSGFGFVFRNYDPYSLFAQIVRSLETFRQDKVWHKLQMTAMGQDNSWEERATEYTKLYNKALQLGRRKLAKEGKLEI